MVVCAGTDSYFDTTLSGVPSGSDVSDGTYPGWCSDEDHGIHSGTIYTYTMTFISSYDVGNIPSWFADEYLDKVNYILNNRTGR